MELAMPRSFEMIPPKAKSSSPISSVKSSPLPVSVFPSSSSLGVMMTARMNFCTTRLIMCAKHAVMSAGRVRSRFWYISDSTGRSCRRVVTRLISDRLGYSGVATRPVFRSVGLRPQPDLTSSGSGLILSNPTRPIRYNT